MLVKNAIRQPVLGRWPVVRLQGERTKSETNQLPLNALSRFPGALVPIGIDVVDFSGQPGSSPIPRPLGHYVLASDTDDNGFARMGKLWALMDVEASILAAQHANNQTVVTAGVDRMRFTDRARAFDIVTVDAQPVYAGRYSVEMKVKLNATRKKGPDWETRPIGEGYWTFVAIGDNRLPVPPLSPDYEALRFENERAQRRKTNRLEEQELLKKLGKLLNTPIRDDEALSGAIVRQPVTRREVNPRDVAFGGVILDVLWQSAEKAAKLHAGESMRLIRQDRMRFDKPGPLGSTLVARPVITRTWDGDRLEVQVDLIAQTRSKTPSSWLRWWDTPNTPDEELIASSLYLFERVPGTAEIPPLAPRSLTARRRWEAAGIREHFRTQEMTLLKP